MNRHVQLGVRRNGLHAIRGWRLNKLKICPGLVMDQTGYSYEGDSWFSWTIRRYSEEELVGAAADKPYVTLESVPLQIALQVVDRLGAILILHLRSLPNWLASSIVLGRNRDGNTNIPLHLECIAIWQQYCCYAL